MHRLNFTFFSLRQIEWIALQKSNYPLVALGLWRMMNDLHDMFKWRVAVRTASLTGPQLAFHRKCRGYSKSRCHLSLCSICFWAVIAPVDNCRAAHGKRAGPEMLISAAAFRADALPSTRSFSHPSPVNIGRPPAWNMLAMHTQRGRPSAAARAFFATERQGQLQSGLFQWKFEEYP
jgi:hypothetical protein